MDSESNIADTVTANQGTAGATAWLVDPNTGALTLTSPWSVYTSGTLGASGVGVVIKASAAKAKSVVNASNYSASTNYLMLFNKATAPVTGDIPFLIVLLQATTSLGRDCVEYPCSAGLSAGISSTATTFTSVAVATSVFTMMYK